MLTRRKKEPDVGTRKEENQKSGVHIVFISTTELATMKRSDSRVIGVYENVQEAETLEQKFNKTAQETDGILTKAYIIRYRVPYTAPMFEDMPGP